MFDSTGKAVYPTEDGETVTAAHSFITRYTFRAGSAVPVYCDTAMTTMIGILNDGEEVYCIEAGTSLLLVWYKLDSGNGYKTGYVRRGAGTVY